MSYEDCKNELMAEIQKRNDTRKAMKHLQYMHHPDHGGDGERFKMIVRVYEAEFEAQVKFAENQKLKQEDEVRRALREQKRAAHETEVEEIKKRIHEDDLMMRALNRKEKKTGLLTDTAQIMEELEKMPDDYLYAVCETLPKQEIDKFIEKRDDKTLEGDIAPKRPREDERPLKSDIATKRPCEDERPLKSDIATKRPRKNHVKLPTKALVTGCYNEKALKRIMEFTQPIIKLANEEQVTTALFKQNGDAYKVDTGKTYAELVQNIFEGHYWKTISIDIDEEDPWVVLKTLTNDTVAWDILKRNGGQGSAAVNNFRRCFGKE